MNKGGKPQFMLDAKSPNLRREAILITFMRSSLHMLLSTARVHDGPCVVFFLHLF
jgi:hypothetical protein